MLNNFCSNNFDESEDDIDTDESEDGEDLDWFENGDGGNAIGDVGE